MDETVESAAKAVGELAFEHEFAEPAPALLFRVVSVRTYHGRDIRHVNWFATVEAARKHAAWIADGRGEVLSIARYYRNP